MWRPDRFTLLLALLGVVGTALVLLRLYHGVGVNGDAKYYIEVARALAEGERGLQWFLGQIPTLLWDDYTVWGTAPLVFRLEQSAQWPPLYSVLLAMFGGFAFDARDIAGPLNAVAFGLTIYVAGQWMRLVVRSRLLVVLGCAAILFSVTVAGRATWAYSETVFMLFASLALLNATRHLKEQNRSSLIWAAAFTALACLTRYSGIVLILSAVTAQILWSGPDYINRAKRSLLYLTISTIPLALWLLRNYLLTESLTGPRGEAKGGPFVNHAARGLSSMEAWNPLMVDLRALVLPLDPEPGRIVGVLFAGVILSGLAGLVLWGSLHWWRSGADDHRLGCLVVAGSYAFLHIAFTNVNAALGNLTLDARQVIPAYVPLVVVMIMGIDLLKSDFRILPVRATLWGEGRSEGKPAIFSSAVVVFFICIAYAGFVSVRDTHRAVFNPEYGWNAYVYNADHVNVETASLNSYLHDRVGDSTPIAREHFDLYLTEGSLFYFREGCTQEDFARKISLRVVPANPIDLSGIRKNFGLDILSFYPARQGARQDHKCLAIAPLPAYDLDLITTGQRDEEPSFWEVTIEL